MRIATLILALLLVVPVTIQSCTIAALGGAVGEKSAAEGGSVGLLVALFWLIGAAFVWGLPTISIVAFLLAAVLAFMVAATTKFSDMNIWGGVALIFAGLSFLSRREIRAKKRGRGTPEEKPA